MSDNEVVKKIGRPKTKKEGDPTIARPIIYIVEGFNNSASDNNYGVEEYRTPAGQTKEEQKQYTKQFVVNLFASKNWSSIKIYGPFYDAKGLAEEIKPQSAPLSEDLEIEQPLGNAEFNGWSGKAFSVKDRKDIMVFNYIKSLSDKLSGGKKVGIMEQVPAFAVKLLSKV